MNIFLIVKALVMDALELSAKDLKLIYEAEQLNINFYSALSYAVHNPEAAVRLNRLYNYGYVRGLLFKGATLDKIKEIKESDFYKLYRTSDKFAARDKSLIHATRRISAYTSVYMAYMRYAKYYYSVFPLDMYDITVLRSKGFVLPSNTNINNSILFSIDNAKLWELFTKNHVILIKNSRYERIPITSRTADKLGLLNNKPRRIYFQDSVVGLEYENNDKLRDYRLTNIQEEINRYKVIYKSLISSSPNGGICALDNPNLGMLAATGKYTATQLAKISPTDYTIGIAYINTFSCASVVNHKIIFADSEFHNLICTIYVRVPEARCELVDDICAIIENITKYGYVLTQTFYITLIYIFQFAFRFGDSYAISKLIKYLYNPTCYTYEPCKKALESIRAGNNGLFYYTRSSYYIDKKYVHIPYSCYIINDILFKTVMYKILTDEEADDICDELTKRFATPVKNVFSVIYYTKGSLKHNNEHRIMKIFTLIKTCKYNVMDKNIKYMYVADMFVRTPNDALFSYLVSNRKDGPVRYGTTTLAKTIKRLPENLQIKYLYSYLLKTQ
jgi:hypothetical protein